MIHLPRVLEACVDINRDSAKLPLRRGGFLEPEFNSVSGKLRQPNNLRKILRGKVVLQQAECFSRVDSKGIGDDTDRKLRSTRLSIKRTLNLIKCRNLRSSSLLERSTPVFFAL